MRQWIGSALVQIMACRLFANAGLLSIGPLGRNFEFNHNTKLSIHENAPEYIVCEMTAIVSRRWVNIVVAEHLVCHLVSHYSDVIMTTMASQINSLTVVYSTVYSDADQRKHQSSASLAFVWGIHRDRWIPRTKGQLRGKCFHLMTSSCKAYSELVSNTGNMDQELGLMKHFTVTSREIYAVSDHR